MSQTNIDSTRTPVADEEIAFAILEEPNVWIAAAVVAEIMASRAGGTKSKQIGKLKIAYGSEHYMALARSLRARGSSYQTGFAGGISIAAKNAQFDDSDWPEPAFKLGLHDHPET